MYKYLRRIMGIAESIGNPTTVDLGDWVSGKERILISGTMEDGRKFEMELTVEKEAKTDGN